MVEFLQVRPLQRELVKALGQKAADADKGRVLQVHVDAGNRGELAAKLLDDLVHVRALGARLEAHEHAAIVAADGGTARADGGHVAGDVGVLVDDAHQGQLVLAHSLEGNVLPRFGDAKELAGVFTGEKALGNDDKQRRRGEEDEARDEHGQAAVAQDVLQAPIVGPQQAVEEPLGNGIDAAMLLVARRLDETAAQHRGEGQRHKARDEHRHHDGHGELVEQPSQNTSHEEHRDEHRRQRQRHRNDRETDFARAFERRRERRFAGLHVPHDVLQHHDGVIHHEANRERQRHQREIVHAVAQQIHDGKGADNRHRQRQAGNDGGREIAQEQKDDQHHQADGEQECELHVVD